MTFATVLQRLAKIENPYPGLRPFETSESHLFFGRDQQILDLCDRLTRNRFVAVLGLSGSGKSSLVRAGLIPALQRGRLLEPGRPWRIAQARPSGNPFANLAAALNCHPSDLRSSSHALIEIAGNEQPLLVLIDQFEELFRYKDRAAGDSATPSEAAAFISLLLASARSPLPIYVVITMRTDYLGDCAEFPEFPEALNESQYLVPRLTREQRRQAIEGPLGRVQISSALVEQILNDAGDEPDQLPILQHALMRTWSHWRKSSPQNDRAISPDDYQAIGGFADALNQHANELLQSLSDPEFAEIIFKRLTALGRSNRERRDPAQLSELWELCNAVNSERQKRVSDVIELFRQDEATFLAPRDGHLAPDTFIDIVHESLIRNWKKLAEEWLPEQESQAKTLAELLDRARGWQAGARELLTGLDLSAALEWNSQRNRYPKWAEHYVGARGVEEVEAYLSASHRRVAQSAKLRALEQQRLVEFQKKLAESPMFHAKSRGLATKAEAPTTLRKHGENLATAIHAFSVEKTTEAREAIAHAFPEELAILQGHSGAIATVAFSPFGQRVVTASADRTARIWNAASGQSIAELEGHCAEVVSAAFSPDGQRVVTASADKTARIWDAANGHLIAKLEGHSAEVISAAFSPDGRLVATASGDRTARVWNAAEGQLTAKMEGHSGIVLAVEFSPDGQRVVTASNDGTARVWNAATGQLTAKLEGHSDWVLSAAFSPDGQRVVASGDNTARIWDAATGQLMAKLEGHSEQVRRAAFSSDGQRVLTASVDRTARVWDATTGHLMAELEGHAATVGSAAFSPDGRLALTASDDKSARVWDVATGHLIAKLEGHSGAVWSAAFSPDGRFVATASADNTARLWNTSAAGAVTARLDGFSGMIESAAFSPDGQRILTLDAKSMWLWNADSGRLIDTHERPSSTDPDGFPAFSSPEIIRRRTLSPDGGREVTASGDHAAEVRNTATGQLVAKLLGHSGDVLSAAFSPDRSRIVTGSDDKTARIWNALTGQLIATLAGHSGSVTSVAFSPDGQRIVTASQDGTALIWRIVTLDEITRLLAAQ
jgi:WD40 repeat protein